jgi:hypothetical protein
MIASRCVVVAWMRSAPPLGVVSRRRTGAATVPDMLKAVGNRLPAAFTPLAERGASGRRGERRHQ